jgi:hypothetical protein
MNDDLFLERLRTNAADLRYEPADPATWTRLSSRIRARIAEPPPTVGDWLARWFRPLGASLVTVALTATLGSTWMMLNSRDTSVMEAFSSDSAELSMLDGALSNVGD